MEAKKISKYCKEELKKQRKTSKNWKTKDSLGPKKEDLKNLITNLRETEIKDDPLERIKNPLNSFEGFLQEIAMLEYASTTYPIKIKFEFMPKSTPRLVEIPFCGSFLNIDCVSNMVDAIENWEIVYKEL